HFSHPVQDDHWLRPFTTRERLLEQKMLAVARHIVLTPARGSRCITAALEERYALHANRRTEVQRSHDETVRRQRGVRDLVAGRPGRLDRRPGRNESAATRSEERLHGYLKIAGIVRHVRDPASVR